MVELGILLRSTIPALPALDLAEEAERRGFHSIWVTEGAYNQDAITQMTAMAMRTKRILVASGIVPIYSRSPVLAGMTAMGLHLFSGGRAILGLGTSHPFIVEDAHGLKLDHPITRMREYVEIVRKTHWEEEFSYHGRVYTIPNYRNPVPPLGAHVPIFIAALRSQMLRLGGAVADGVLMNMVPPHYLRHAVEIIKEGAQSVGRDPSQLTIGTIVMAGASRDQDAAAEALRLRVANYAVLTPFYHKMFEEAGFAKEMAEIAPEVQRKDIEAAAKKIPDSLITALGLLGTPQEWREQTKAFEDAGAQLVVLMPTVPEDGKHDVIQGIGDMIQSISWLQT